MRVLARAVSAALLTSAMLGAGGSVAHANNIMERLAAECLGNGGYLDSVKNATGGWDHVCHYGT